MSSNQLYLILASMRSANQLAKRGRSGYVAVGGDKLLPGVKKALNEAQNSVPSPKERLWLIFSGTHA